MKQAFLQEIPIFDPALVLIFHFVSTSFQAVHTRRMHFSENNIYVLLIDWFHLLTECFCFQHAVTPILEKLKVVLAYTHLGQIKRSYPLDLIAQRITGTASLAMIRK